MKKSLLTITLCSFAFGLGFGVNNIAFSNAQAPKIAYVDVAKLVSTSKIMKTAQQEREKQTKEMLKWYDTASADIQKQQTKEGKQALIKKYEAQLTTKKKNINSAYMKKVESVDKQLNTIIKDKSSAMGYNVVLRKEAVLVGGDDLTSSIIPLVK